MPSKIIIAPSILAADFANLEQETKAVLAAGADVIHFDVMDFHFVPNLSVGPFVCTALRRAGIIAPIEAHLMVDEPEKYIEPFAKAGANILTFHAETAKNPAKLIDAIHRTGMKAGIAFNPETPFALEVELVQKLALILIMSVHPGFAGQKFIPEALEKIKQARACVTKNKTKTFVAVDGGIKLSNIDQVAKAGADFIVLGSGIFEAEDYAERIQALREKLSGC
ncbi:MAG: ribulose-phosphate 3-epimerase [Gammaproteobacteria bacterium RIFOXYB2_FULL_38_6]|nr:MAG: ribulose-phosphate 3-epimerase [Gammaproteobacteria bacterium RIFOXYB2_FULL_38_6]